MGFGFGEPFAHSVGILLGVLLDGLRWPTVGVALTQYRVYSASLYLVITLLDIPLFVVLGIFRIVGNSETLALQLFDAGLELWNGGADVGKFDDVGGRGFDHSAKFSQIVGYTLVIGQFFREYGKHASGQGNIHGADGNACCTGKFLDDGQEGGAGKLRRFVNLGVDDVRRSLI